MSLFLQIVTIPIIAMVMMGGIRHIAVRLCIDNIILIITTTPENMSNVGMITDFKCAMSNNFLSITI